MYPSDIPEAGWSWQLFAAIGEGLPPIVYIAGLAISVWAFIRCRKCGYLVIASYFAVILLSSYIWLPIHRDIEAHRSPDMSDQIQQQIDKAQEQAAIEAQAKTGQPFILAHKTIAIPFCPILLVAGLWFLARRETRVP
jgi:hypothetical protein